MRLLSGLCGYVARRLSGERVENKAVARRRGTKRDALRRAIVETLESRTLMTGTAADALLAYQDVYNNVVYQPYLGLLKGASATANTNAGNDWDQANLLVNKLANVGVTSSIQAAIVSPSITDVERWLGVTDPKAAFTILQKSTPTYFDPMYDLSQTSDKATFFL